MAIDALFVSVNHAGALHAIASVIIDDARKRRRVYIALTSLARRRASHFDNVDGSVFAAPAGDGFGSPDWPTSRESDRLGESFRGTLRLDPSPSD
jgi:hypothetical protein